MSLSKIIYLNNKCDLIDGLSTYSNTDYNYDMSTSIPSLTFSNSTQKGKRSFYLKRKQGELSKLNVDLKV